MPFGDPGADWLLLDPDVQPRHTRYDLARATDRMGIDLDLTYDSAQQTWAGLFHRGDFSGDVVLRRPIRSPAVPASSLVGTWVNTGTLQTCLHIVERPDGTLGGWSDTLRASGLDRYANGLKRPNKTYEYYGEPFNVVETKHDVFSMEFGTNSGMCCPHKVSVSLSTDGSRLDRAWQPGPNQASAKAGWERVLGDSCR
jgi:hypothetical protein